MFRTALLPLVVIGCSQTYKTDDTAEPSFADSGDTAGDTAADTDTDTDTDSDTDTDTGSDTGVDTGGDTSIDTGIDTGGSCPSTQTQMVWVVETLEVASATGGMDLDGDGRGDNVMAAVRDALNDEIVETFPTTPVVLAWQMWEVDDWCDDADITGAFLSPSDADGNHADDYSGSEAFDAGAQIDGRGLAVENGPGAIAEGTYRFTLANGSFDVGGFTLVNATTIYVEGTADESANVGQFAFGLPKALMEEIAVEEGYDPALATALADLDSDGDGVMDALSITFDFTAVPATVY